MSIIVDQRQWWVDRVGRGYMYLKVSFLEQSTSLAGCPRVKGGYQALRGEVLLGSLQLSIPPHYSVSSAALEKESFSHTVSDKSLMLLFISQYSLVMISVAKLIMSLFSRII